jgi:hypothetical protein
LRNVGHKNVSVLLISVEQYKLKRLRMV